MADLPLLLTAADYARMMPLATGMVKPEGIDLTLLLGTSGSWPERATMLRRALNDPVVHGGEASMAGHLRRVEAGDRSHVAIPVFPLRNFTARDLYVRKGGPVRTAADLIGKRVGMYDWVASGSIWYRHFLRFIGVDPAAVQWWIGEVDEPRITSHTYTLPDGVHGTPPGQALSEMLINGELDALLSPPKPRKYHPANGPLTRLFPDFRAVERDYFRQTGMFPPQHLMVVVGAADERPAAKGLLRERAAGRDGRGRARTVRRVFRHDRRPGLRLGQWRQFVECHRARPAGGVLRGSSDAQMKVRINGFMDYWIIGIAKPVFHQSAF